MMNYLSLFIIYNYKSYLIFVKYKRKHVNFNKGNSVHLPLESNKIVYAFDVKTDILK